MTLCHAHEIEPANDGIVILPHVSAPLVGAVGFGIISLTIIWSALTSTDESGGMGSGILFLLATLSLSVMCSLEAFGVESIRSIALTSDGLTNKHWTGDDAVSWDDVCQFKVEEYYTDGPTEFNIVGRSNTGEKLVTIRANSYWEHFTDKSDAIRICAWIESLRTSSPSGRKQLLTQAPDLLRIKPSGKQAQAELS